MDLDVFLTRVRSSKQLNYFYHFTDKKNLDSIRARGLLCTSELRRLGILKDVITGGDENSLASDTKNGIDKYVCLCFTTNHPMSYRAKERGVDPVYLSINPDIIKSNGVMITDAASNQSGVIPQAASAALDNLHLDVIYQWIDWGVDPDAHDRDQGFLPRGL
jgi:hypothetical protein